MGMFYDAVVVAAAKAPLLRELEDLPDTFAPISFEVYRVKGRGFVIFAWREIGPPEATDEMEELAMALSLKFGKAVAVHMVDNVQIRESTLYEEGKLVRSFGEEDELWAPMDENGDELPGAPCCQSSAIPEGEDYAFVWDGIDAGLEAAGFRSWFRDSVLEAARKKALIWERTGVE
jgi:hypothetical protein